MQILKLKYHQFLTNERHWVLHEVEFERINLLVGKNSSGKSKSLNVINGLSNILSENSKLQYDDGYYEIIFNRNNQKYKYVLDYKDHKISCERLEIDNEVKINRGEDNKGYIISSNGTPHDFEIPDDELKANRRDKSNYPYLEELNYWANHVRIFQFSSMPKNFALKDATKNPSKFNLKDTNATIVTFSQGNLQFPESFKRKVISDFNSIGYNIEDISIGAQISANLQVIDNPAVEVVGLRVKEVDLDCITDLWDMSNGMFRALSVIIHFNYYELANIAGTVLIDDIGEGLDYDRSAKLLNLLISKTEANENMQLIMSTNDSFIMNAVDLKYWQIIDRVGADVRYYNHKNAKEIFDDYKFTGLNNFDFFATDFFKTGFIKQED